MRFFRGFIKTLTASALALCSFVFSQMFICDSLIAESYSIAQGEKLGISEYVSIEQKESEECSVKKELNEISAQARLFGIFPIKDVTLTESETKKVVPGGIPFGIKMLSDGVIVSAVTAIEQNGKLTSPAREVGIKSGDVIIKVNDKKVRSNSELIREVQKSEGNKLKLDVKHQNGKEETLFVSPVLDSKNKEYKLGVLIRDSSAGIGTVTFFDEQSGVFAGLGHGVCDAETGNIMSLYEGEVVISEIDSIKKSVNGTPGQLNGHFASSRSVGNILKNDDTGVYGTLSSVKVVSPAVEVAFKQEVKVGKATMLTTVEGSAPEEFEIEIEKISYNENRSVKNMVVCVTDKRLLSISGGIVQGMSGSPIIQNGKLVGAVTHVLVNDPTRGYGIFIENMLETANHVAEEQALKDAS